MLAVAHCRPKAIPLLFLLLLLNYYLCWYFCCLLQFGTTCYSLPFPPSKSIQWRTGRLLALVASKLVFVLLFGFNIFRI